MRIVSLFAAVLLLATVLLAGSNFQPMEVKTGLWQVTEISNISGLPPQMQGMMGQMSGGKARPISYKTCVKAKDLNSNPWANGSQEKCTWTVLNSSASDMEVKGTSCEAGKEQGMQTDVNLKIHAVDSENVKGTADGTAVGNGMNVKLHNTYSGKWVSATCPTGE
jgi:Protein of unknown function (DUF3617)